LVNDTCPVLEQDAAEWHLALDRHSPTQTTPLEDQEYGQVFPALNTAAAFDALTAACEDRSQ
jgi:hypothetical protein